MALYSEYTRTLTFQNASKVYATVQHGDGKQNGEQTDYDYFDLKIVYERHKTGFQEQTEFPIVRQTFSKVSASLHLL